MMPSTVTRAVLSVNVQASIHSSSECFLSPSHVSGTMSRMASDTRASLML